MSADFQRPLSEPTDAQQRFLSLFLRSEREIFRYVAALVPNMADADDIVQQTAVALWESIKTLQRIRQTLQRCVEAEAGPEWA